MIYKIILEILCIIEGFFGLIYLYRFLRKMYIETQIRDNPFKIAGLGHSICINGKKGAGKTTTAAMLVCELTNYLINLIQARMEEIKNGLKEFNFVEIEKMFDEYYNLSEDYVVSSESVIDYLKKEEKFFLFYYTNFLTIFKKEDMIFDYLHYYYILNYRGIYVYSQGYLFNCATFHNAKLFDPSSVQIRNVLAKQNYQGDWCTIIFNDEKNITDGNVFSNSKSVKLSGSKESLALKRHQGKGTCFQIDIGQVATDIVLQERNQFDVNLEIYDKVDFILYNRFTTKVLFLLYKIPKFFVKKWLKLKSFFIRGKSKKTYYERLYEFDSKNNFLRRLKYRLSQIDSYLKRDSYIRSRCRAYYRADDVGKNDDKLYEKYVFYNNTHKFYGAIDTYEYAPILDKFSKMDQNAIDEYVSKMDADARFNLFMETLKKGEKND